MPNPHLRLYLSLAMIAVAITHLELEGQTRSIVVSFESSQMNSIVLSSQGYLVADPVLEMMWVDVSFM